MCIPSVCCDSFVCVYKGVTHSSVWVVTHLYVYIMACLIRVCVVTHLYVYLMTCDDSSMSRHTHLNVSRDSMHAYVAVTRHTRMSHAYIHIHVCVCSGVTHLGVSCDSGVCVYQMCFVTH